MKEFSSKEEYALHADMGRRNVSLRRAPSWFSGVLNCTVARLHVRSWLIVSNSVESTTGAVAVGREGSCCPTAFALRVPYQLRLLLRFPSSLIEPDVRNYRIQLSPSHQTFALDRSLSRAGTLYRPSVL